MWNDGNYHGETPQWLKDQWAREEKERRWKEKPLHPVLAFLVRVVILAVLTIVVVFAAGLGGFLTAKEQICQPFELIPAVACTPVGQASEGAAIAVVVIVGMAAVILTVLRFLLVRRWRSRVREGVVEPMPTVRYWSLTFFRFAAFLLGLVLVMTFSASTENPPKPQDLRAWPTFLVAFFIVGTSALNAIWATWGMTARRIKDVPPEYLQ